MARTITLCFATILQTDTVVARSDMTIGDAYVLRVVEIDAVAITDLQVVQQVDAIDDGLVAANQMHCPVSPLLDGHVADGQVLHIRQGQHMRTRIEGLVCKGFKFVGVFQLSTHKGDTIAMNGALASDADIVGVLGPEPQHTLAAVLTKGTQLINRLIGIGLQSGSRL